MALQTITKVGAFDQDIANQINANFAVAGSTAGNTHITGTLTVDGASTLTGNATLSGTEHLVGALTADSTGAFAGILTWAPKAQVASGSADAVLFADALNVCVLTSTGPDTATLATPGASDVGKILILVNDSTSQNTVATAAGKIRKGTGSPGATLTAPATAGAVAVLIASNGFWNLAVFGTGTWVLS